MAERNAERERLIEMLGKFPLWPSTMGERWMPEAVERLADHLIANGVVVPPMKLGQTCFDLCTYRNKADECRVSSITQKADGTFKIRLTNLRGKWVFEITADNIGKTVLLDREEAEKALAERKEQK